MSLKLTTHKNGNIVVVDTSGKLTLGESTGAFRSKIKELVDGGSRRFVINMAELTYMDSSGMGELIAAHTSISHAGGEIKLLNLAKHVHDLLAITKLYTVFESFEDEGAAIASFKESKSADSQG
jgi:anti-sigma B factor antagonist